MSRTYVVTGAASGIGLATRELLLERGHHVIGVDLQNADVNVDLCSPAGRDDLVTQVSELSGGSVDAVLAVAGLATPTVATVAVNYYGTIATLVGLRPLMLHSKAPRAVMVTSMASLFPPDEELLKTLLDGAEQDALARAAELVAAGREQSALIYGTSKRALSLWVRRNAAQRDWAAAGIPLNAVAPGIVRTPMVAEQTATEESRRALLELVPMPLNGFFEPRAAAYLLHWLASEENAHLCGQVIFMDGGSDVVIRQDSTW